MANWIKTYLQNHPDVAARSVIGRARYSFAYTAVRRPGGVILHRLAHTLPGCGRLGTCWTRPCWLDTVRNEYRAPGLPTRITLDGVIRIASQANPDTTLWTQQTSRVGLFNTSTRAFSNVQTADRPRRGENVIASRPGTATFCAALRPALETLTSCKRRLAEGLATGP